jgi:putative hydrolase of the HAD superfamily
MVGDAPLEDVGGGKRAGLLTAWIDLGRVWELPGYAPDLVAGSAPEVVDRLLS